MGIHTEYFNRQDYQTIGDFIYESLVSLKNAGAELEAGLSPVVPSKEDQIILGKLFLSWLIKNYGFLISFTLLLKLDIIELASTK